MLDKLYLIPLFPLIGFLILVLLPLSKRWIPFVGVGSVASSALVVALIIIQNFGNLDTIHFEQALWTWISIGHFNASFSFYVDSLTIVMLSVVTGVGALIHLYSAGFMAEDESYARFFAYLNLFVCAMLILVLADNFLLLFLGWEGVGACSYLLIGFWYKDPANGTAARKAFVVTRVGDAAMAIGVFFIFKELQSINIQTALLSAQAQWPVGSLFPLIAAMLLLGGAVGKSAQLPLQIWLPDAMAGPTPVSALIHAATMVTAGVYLIARTHPLFELAPIALAAVALVGLLTLLIAGISALGQNDLKRVLAYSTISQIGYMFLGLGVGAYAASVSHLVNHAFFKALLFLTAGSIIHCLHHEHNIFKMGGIWKKQPLIFACFLIGSACLAALPFTSGFYSKDAILMATMDHPIFGNVLWVGGLAGAFLTAIYSFRLLFVVFFGEQQTEVSAQQNWQMKIPLIVLSVLALIGGLLHLPLGNVFSHHNEHPHETFAVVITTLIPILGLGVACVFFLFKWVSTDFIQQSLLLNKIQQFMKIGLGFDQIYYGLFVIPYQTLSRINKNDLVDGFYGLLVGASRSSHQLLRLTQSGYTRWYVATMVMGFAISISYLLRHF